MTRILLIEDNSDLLRTTIDFLNYEGFQTFEASDGLTGIELAIKYKPDLILCDIMMADLDGYEVRRTLSSYPETSLIPFIFLTALSGNDEIRKGMELGADDYLTKPFQLETLKKSIEVRIDKSKEIQRNTQNQLNELRDRIIHTLPHELLTPLNGILGCSSLLLSDNEAINHPQIMELATIIENSGNRLHHLINNHLKYVSEITENYTANNNQVVHSRELIHKISTTLASSVSRENDLKMEIEDTTLPLAPEDFIYIIKELLSNALKFSDKGSEIKICAKNLENDYKITITDQGMGFPHLDDEILNKIGAFNQFSRERYEQQGAGLGLITSYLTILRYYGTLDIKNNDKGASVTVYLPRLEPQITQSIE
jgi:signal transduction histidine kinase